jgi:DNA polymerase-3 subunit alpha
MLGFADYFLITEKIVKYAKDTFGEWSVGLGRGSGAGSIISWCLGITDIDPIKYELIFERFLDESRQSIYVCTFDE